MKKIDSIMIDEDLHFMKDYINELLKRHPEIAKEDQDILQKFVNRMNDISKRL